MRPPPAMGGDAGVGGVDRTWAADLVDMNAFSRENEGHKFILSIIDIFYKYNWLVPPKDKKGTNDQGSHA